jgi:cytochrome c553
MENEVGGCYNDCYAAKSASRYGYDFGETILRNFDNEYHRREVVNQINRIKLDFVRIGCSGDPSENWEHTIKILKQIDKCNKEIVIITRHWTTLTHEHLQYLKTINVCFNTSVSALDKPKIMNKCLEQYERLKPYCKSVLRVISCDFNQENEVGRKLLQVQNALFKNESILDTVFRPGKLNRWVTNCVVNVKESTFLSGKQLISKRSPATYIGKCSTCHEMCGLNINNKNYSYPERRGRTKQLEIFRRSTPPTHNTDLQRGSLSGTLLGEKETGGGGL